MALDSRAHFDLEFADLREELSRLHSVTSAQVRRVVGRVTHAHALGLSRDFYEAVQSRPRAHFYLDNAVVAERLQAALQNWLETLFSKERGDLDEIVRLQLLVGSAHARIRVPIGLIMYGTRVLRQRLYELLKQAPLPSSQIAQAHAYVSGSLDIALSAMTAAHMSNLERNTRADEALRLYSIGKDLQAERERQRAALAEWGQNAFFHAQFDDASPGGRSLGRSEFGLWLLHQGDVIFSQFREYPVALEAVGKIDEIILALAAQEDRREALQGLKTSIDLLARLVALLFDHATGVEGARDPVTQLLHRRYLRAALSREIGLQEKVPHPFCAILAEIAGAAELRARLGEEAADVLAQHAATMIFNASRSSDSVFQFGRDRFFVIRVETSQAEAQDFVDQISAVFAASRLDIGGHVLRDLSLDAAVVEYDGHPDPRNLIERAEMIIRKIRQARTPGRP